MIDETHDATRKSWVASANGHAAFPIQNLPLGVFSRSGGESHGGVAIGDEILDLSAALDAELFSGAAKDAAQAAAGSTLNDFLALGRPAATALRRRLGEILDADSPDAAKFKALAVTILAPAADCRMHLPARIGDYTDFYAGIHHARNIGLQFRPDQPLMPNYQHVPIGYHGRASSVRTSGAVVKRPNGQRKPPTAEVPDFGPARRLDYELELAVWIGPGNDIGETVPIADAEAHIAGVGLLNDWSARDLQAWEYQPLGPFLAKNFVTTVSPWIVTMDALAPFRTAQPPRPEGDPKPLPYLWDEGDQAHGAFAIELEVALSTKVSRDKGLPAHVLSRGTSLDLYWTLAQMVAHHASGGCDLHAGDLFGTGTISAAQESGFGSLMELSRGATQALTLPWGETRNFLEDGDEIELRARCEKAGFAAIGFGPCIGRVTAADPVPAAA